MTEELSPQQQHQRKVWEEARRCRPRAPLSEEEKASRKERADLVSSQINRLLAFLNDGPANTVRTTIPIVINGMTVDFNLAAVEYAVRAQNFGWRTSEERDHGLTAILRVDGQLFPDLELRTQGLIDGEKIIRKEYTFDADTRVVTLLVTRCKPAENGDTWGQARYDTAYESSVVLDNLHWRCVINDMISSFGDVGYVHLYKNSFKYIWDHETCQTTIHPSQDDGSFVGVPKPRWEPSLSSTPLVPEA